MRARPLLTELAASVLAGAAGTAAMGAMLAVERRVRGGRKQVGHPLDYDASRAPVRAVQNLTGAEVPDQVRPVVRWGLHWGYGSGAAVLRTGLGRLGLGEPAATLGFWALGEGLAMVMFPASGATPPPWRWRRDMVATSVVAHLVYAVGTSAALPVTRRLAGASAPAH